MEKTNKVEVNATEPVDQQARPRVVFVTDEPLPEALRALFPDAEVVSPSKSCTTERCGAGCPDHESVIDKPTLDEVKGVAIAKLMTVASKRGLSFDNKELDALFHLSMAFSPQLAMAAAHAACDQYLAAWGRQHG